MARQAWQRRAVSLSAESAFVDISSSHEIGPIDTTKIRLRPTWGKFTDAFPTPGQDARMRRLFLLSMNPHAIRESRR
jgi:hypothetical protein